MLHKKRIHIYSSGNSSEYYGPCEVCRKRVGDVHVISIQDYFDIEDGITRYSGPSMTFGHKDCLLSKFFEEELCLEDIYNKSIRTDGTVDQTEVVQGYVAVARTRTTENGNLSYPFISLHGGLTYDYHTAYVYKTALEATKDGLHKHNYGSFIAINGENMLMGSREVTLLVHANPSAMTTAVRPVSNPPHLRSTSCKVWYKTIYNVPYEISDNEVAEVYAKTCDRRSDNNPIEWSEIGIGKILT